MDILAGRSDDATGPTGAAALLGYAAAEELERFERLEDGLWERSSLAPSVLECVRLRCASARGCRFCAAIRVTSAVEDGLAEQDLDHLDDPAARRALSPQQRAALDLADRYLLYPSRPPASEADHLVAVLGGQGIVEVLLACAVFASADLRIALGQNAPPEGSGVVERRHTGRPALPGGCTWPRLDGPIVVPGEPLPLVDTQLVQLLEGLRSWLWDGRDLRERTVATCVVRAAQLLGFAPEEPTSTLLLPPAVRELAPSPEEVARWPATAVGVDRAVVALGEQLWVDPAGVGERLVAPLQRDLGTAGVIRVAWRLIWIGQLHRIAGVLTVGIDRVVQPAGAQSVRRHGPS